MFREETTTNLDEDAAVSRWSRGFIRGYSWLRDVWNEFIPKELDKELGSILVVLSFFSSRRMAEELCAEMDGGKPLGEAAAIPRGPGWRIATPIPPLDHTPSGREDQVGGSST